MKRKLFSLVTLLLCAVTGAWADDVCSATQTFTDGRATCTWTELNVSVAKNGTVGGDGLYFVAGSSGNITTSSGAVNIKSGRTMYVEVPSASSYGTITIIGSADKDDRTVSLNSGSTIKMLTTGDAADFVATDVENVNGAYYIKVASTSDFKFTSVKVELDGGETYPAAAAADPVFSLTTTTISTSGTSQIQVGSKGNLDGIVLSDITYGTSGIVSVNATTGVVTPVAVGTTTITFNSGAVAGKYNASTANEVTISVVTPITVFDASALNTEFVLSQANVENAINEFVTVSEDNWVDRTPTGYSAAKYFNLSGTSRNITFKASGASTFKIVIQNGSGSNDRKYTVKIGDAAGVDITAPKNTTSTSVGFATGTTDEVTIQIIGTSDGSLYPAAIIFNPAESVTVSDKLYRTYASTSALTFPVTGLTAYKATVVGDDVTFSEVTGDVPAGEGLLLKATTAGTFDIPVAAGTPGAIDNALVGVTAAETIAAGSFILYADATHPIGFYKTGAAFDAGANTAYLPADASPAREFIGLDGDATGIKAVEAQKQENGEYYNLAGQRVAQPTKGLYIVNGKKYIVK